MPFHCVAVRMVGQTMQVMKLRVNIKVAGCTAVGAACTMAVVAPRQSGTLRLSPTTLADSGKRHCHVSNIV